MTSYLRGTTKVTLLCFRWSISPSFLLQKQTENALLECIWHKRHLQWELVIYHGYLINLEVGLNNAFWGVGIKVDVTDIFMTGLAEICFHYSHCFIPPMLVKGLCLRSRKRSFLLQTIGHSMVSRRSPPKNVRGLFPSAPLFLTVKPTRRHALWCWDPLLLCSGSSHPAESSLLPAHREGKHI